MSNRPKLAKGQRRRHLLITGVVASFAVPGWWIVPAAITILLSLSLWRATRPAGAGRQPGFRCRQGLSASTRTSG